MQFTIVEIGQANVSFDYLNFKQVPQPKIPPPQLK